jgi:hypothetical protein
MWEPQPPATLRASTACTGIALPYLPSTISESIALYCVRPTWDGNFQFGQGLLGPSLCSHRLWDPVSLSPAGTVDSVPEGEVARARSWPLIFIYCRSQGCAKLYMYSPLILHTKKSVHFLVSHHVLHTRKQCVITWQILAFFIRY